MGSFIAAERAMIEWVKRYRFDAFILYITCPLHGYSHVHEALNIKIPAI